MFMVVTIIKRKHLIMISFDAVADADIDFLLELPGFSKLSKQGTLVRDVDSVFISNTYPVHTSIITGVYPEKHGIVENLYTQPTKERPGWRRFSKDIKVPTLYNMAAKGGLSVCSIFYPVTCGAGDIRWNMPEIPDEMSMKKRIFETLRSGNSRFIISSLFKNIKFLKAFDTEYLDDFLTHVAIDAIYKHNPDLLLLHLLDVDSKKHHFGPESNHTKEALIRIDKNLSKVVDAAYEAWNLENVAIIVFSDHGCLSVNEAVDPNDCLKKYGLIHLSDVKKDFEAFFHNAGGTSLLKVYNKDKIELAIQAVNDILRKPYAKRLLSNEEMKSSGLDQEFVCGIEAKDGYCFGKAYKGQHGYSLQRERYHPFYLVAGNNIEQGKQLRGGSVLDICPLAAEILGLPAWKMDGVKRVNFI